MVLEVLDDWRNNVSSR